MADMKLHTVFVTHNRLELTKRTIESYLETVTVPYSFTVVDNASTDGTGEWLLEQGYPIDLLTENHYPGYATNVGWGHAWDATHLHRSDNDMEYLPGWCEEVERLFSERPNLGQVGLRTDEEENWVPQNTGGNCVIDRKLWDEGLRWRERPWGKYAPGYSEDSFFSPDVRRMGYEWCRVERPCIRNLASGDWSDPYYQMSYGVRGIRPHPDDPTVPEGFIPYGS